MYVKQNQQKNIIYFFGSANRKLSEQDGLKVWLCPEHHRGQRGVHGKDGATFNNYLKSIAQIEYMKYYNKTKEEFIKRYGRNYIQGGKLNEYKSKSI